MAGIGPFDEGINSYWTQEFIRTAGGASGEILQNEEESKELNEQLPSNRIICSIKQLDNFFLSLYNPNQKDGKTLFESNPVLDGNDSDKSLEEELEVFQNLDPDEDFFKKNIERILFLLDLDNETLLGKEEYLGGEKEGVENTLGEGIHPVLQHSYPTARGHVLLPLFSDQSLPQVLSNDILILLLQIFTLSKNYTIKVGYNSLGGGCSCNHLHFHVLWTDELLKSLPEGSTNVDSLLPIEIADKLPFYTTTLQHKDLNEINMYTMGVILSETNNYCMRSLILQPDGIVSEDNIDQAQESLSYVSALISDILLTSNIPHNMLITEGGMVFYIIPRHFDGNIPSADYATTFLDLSGAFSCLSHDVYANSDHLKFIEYCQKFVSLTNSEFENMKQTVLMKLDAQYEGKTQ